MQATRGASLNDADTHLSQVDQRPRRVGTLFIVAMFVYAVDQVSKFLAVRELADSGPVELLGGLLTLRLVRNPGAAFGIAGGATVVISVIAVIVTVAVLRTARRLHSVGWAIALGLLLGGATGNLTDRLLRDPAPLRGHVVDFLELPHWPVFNAADSAIVTAAVLMMLLSAFGRQLDGTTEHG